MRTTAELEALSRQLGTSPEDLKFFLQRLPDDHPEPTMQELADLDADMAEGLGVSRLTLDDVDAMALSVLGL